MVDLELAFDTDFSETKRALRRLNALRRLITHSAWTPEYLEFVTLFCQLAESCRLAPNTKTNIELRFAHGEQVCNCIWFPVIRHSMDLAYAFVWYIYEIEQNLPISYEQRQTVHLDCRKVIGILRYVETVAFPSWEDFIDHVAPYTPHHLAQLLSMCRAYLVYNRAMVVSQAVTGSELFIRAQNLFTSKRLLMRVADSMGIWRGGRLIHEISRKDKTRSWIHRVAYDAYVAFADYAYSLKKVGTALGAYTLAMNSPGATEPEQYTLVKNVNKSVHHEKVATASEVEQAADQWLNIKLEAVGVNGLSPIKVDAVFKFV